MSGKSSDRAIVRLESRLSQKVGSQQTKAKSTGRRTLYFNRIYPILRAAIPTPKRYRRYLPYQKTVTAARFSGDAMDHYPDFENLKNREDLSTDYLIRWRIGGSGIAILAIHGGEIEPGTSRIAEAIAGANHSFYSFEGIKNSKNRVLHITSNRFDEPTAVEIVCHANIIISIHGSAIMEPVVHLGGLDVEVQDRIRQELKRAGFQVVFGADQRFRGTDHKNICNLCGRGMGVQMEISRGLRATMFEDLSPEGRHHRTAVFPRFTTAVRRAIQPFALEYSPIEPLQGTD
jgi:phage replication-related protein YjqB (UPF0714/DUF867 family)